MKIVFLFVLVVLGLCEKQAFDLGDPTWKSSELSLSNIITYYARLMQKVLSLYGALHDGLSSACARKGDAWTSACKKKNAVLF